MVEALLRVMQMQPKCEEKVLCLMERVVSLD